MNPKCPECQSELPEDFGIVTCTNCGAVCSVDLDGNAEVQGEVEASSNDDSSSDKLTDESAGFDDAPEESLESLEADSFDDTEENYQSVLDSGDDEALSGQDYTSQNEDDLSDLGVDEIDSLEGSEFSDDLQNEGDKLFEESDTADDVSSFEGEQSDETSDSEAFGDDLSDLDSDDYGQSDLDSGLDSGLDSDLAMGSLDEDSSEQIESVDEGPLEEGESDEEDPSQLSKPLSSKGFFKNLELFTEQLDPQDHHHTYYTLKVSGFETNSDLDEVLDLTLDDRLGIIKEGLNFDEANQSFVIPKISFLRLVALHKRLSTLSFIDMEWSLTEDQSDIVDAVEAEGYEDEEATEVGDQMSDSGDDDSLYEEVDESDY